MEEPQAAFLSMVMDRLNTLETMICSGAQTRIYQPQRSKLLWATCKKPFAMLMIAPENGLTSHVRVTPDGRFVSVIDIIGVICFTDAYGQCTKSASKNASDHNMIPLRDHEELSSLAKKLRVH